MSSSRPARIIRANAVPSPEMLVLHGGTPAAGAADAATSHVTTVETLVREAEEQAAAIVADAQRRAAGILAAAEAQRDAVFDEARRHAAEAGRAEALQSVAGEIGALLGTIRAAAGSGQEIRDAIVAGADRTIVELALEVARTILGHRAQVEHDLVREMARRAIERARSQQMVRIRVNPEQTGIVAALVEDLPAAGGLPVVGDGAVDLGGCVVDTRYGFIDARLDTQVDQVGNALLALTAMFDD